MHLSRKWAGEKISKTGTERSSFVSYSGPAFVTSADMTWVARIPGIESAGRCFTKLYSFNAVVVVPDEYASLVLAIHKLSLMSSHFLRKMCSFSTVAVVLDEYASLVLALHICYLQWEVIWWKSQEKHQRQLIPTKAALNCFKIIHNVQGSVPVYAGGCQLWSIISEIPLSQDTLQQRQAKASYIYQAPPRQSTQIWVWMVNVRAGSIPATRAPVLSP